MSDPSDLGSAVAPEAFVDDDAAPAAGDRSRMSFLEHLDELRRRIIYSIYAIVASCAVTFWFVSDLNKYLLGYFSTLAGGKLLATQLTEAFMFEFKIGGFAGLILASPFVFSQLWLFVAPGLYTREKKVVIPFVLSASMLFGTGVWFNHRFAFPTMIKFFVTFSNDYLTQMYQISGIFGFYVKMALGLGLVFEMPMLVFFLARFGIITAGFLLKKTRYAILIIFILAAIITPSPDIMTQLMFALPMLLLYAVSIGVAWVFGKKKPKTLEGV
jgi:sec-independent protein translocase protein TatC